MQLDLQLESQSVADFMRTMKPQIDASVSGLAHTEFVDDPLLGKLYSRVQSIMGSAQKREGRVIEVALREALKQNPALQVWMEPNFAISPAADHLINSQDEDACLASELPYGEVGRQIQIDAAVFQPAIYFICAYEVKRGNGRHDAGSIRSMRRDLLCARALLKSYARTRGYDARHTDAKVIFYYGCRSLGAPYSLIGAEIDVHFDFPVQALIESALAYYRHRVRELLAMMG